ncbi:S-layer homology domain-containing protein [Lysinibacillus telephonicus]|uniref:S-layer homology domain-containing protein n=1 Tax=Lysinibacillus telephonicus TaxID=1714840 RepID=UPI003978DE9E
MANQPKKYKKFVATAATATLVASAIVPVASAAASFPDVAENNSHAEAINALVEAGIIKGYEDGTFKPNAQLTRGHVVKMLGKWVEAQGFEIPADYNTVQRFDDVAVDAADQELVKYAALVKDTGVFLGSDGDLNAADSITRENMALTLDRAYKAVFKKSLVELAAGSTNLTVSDLATAKEEAREEIQALRNLGISNVNTFNPKDTVTRAQFASFLYRTIEAQSTPAEGSALKSATATGVSEVTVVFDGPVNTEAAKFAFARGTTAINVTDVDWSEDKTTAVLTVDTKFADATYTLTVTGVADKELTASIQTTREEVAEINFLSDRLVFTGQETKDFKEVVIAFEVLNQYGEDITKNVINSRFEDADVKGIDVANSSEASHPVTAPTVKDGKFVAWVAEDEDEDETGTVEFTYVNGDYELDVSQDVVLSEISEPGSVELFDIYNASGKALTTSNLKDAELDSNGEPKENYYLLFKVKDQYGVEIDPEFADDRTGNVSSGDSSLLDEVRDGIRVSVSNKDIFDIEDEEEVEVINVDGEYYFSLRLIIEDEEDVEAGENTVEFRARATGEIASKVYKVEGSSEVNKIELLAPDEVIAGNETVRLPIVVTDQNGEKLTDAAELNDELRKTENPGIEIDADMTWIVGANEATAFTFVEDGGELFLEFKTKPNNRNALNSKAEVEEIDIDVTVEKSDEESSITLKLEPDAYAAKLVKVKDAADTYFHENGTGELKLKDFIIEDQYGRVFDDVDKLSNDFEVKVTKVSAGVISQVGTNVLKDTDDKLEFEATNNGSATVEFTLSSKDFTEKAEGAAISDKLSVTLRAVESDDFKSYKVKSDEVVYANTERNINSDVADIEVYGVLSNGVEVEITGVAGLYQVLPGDYLKSTATTTTVDSTDVVADLGEIGTKFDAAGDQSLETGVRVVINATGESIAHKLVVTEARAKAADITLEDSNSIAENDLVELDVTATTSGVISSSDILAALDAHTFEVEDQYGNEATFNENTGRFVFDGTDREFTSGLTLTVSDIVTANDDVKAKDNGRATVSVGSSEDKVVAGDYFTLTIAVDGVSKTVRVNVVSPTTSK